MAQYIAKGEEKSTGNCEFFIAISSPCARALADEGIRTFRVNFLMSCALTLADLGSTKSIVFLSCADGAQEASGAGLL